MKSLPSTIASFKASHMLELDIEGKLKLSFPAEWQATKLDDEPWYRNEMRSQLRAVDVVAAQGTTHWWIEVKDCLGYETENLSRFSPAEPAALSAVRQLLAQNGLDKEVKVKRAKPFIIDELAEKITGSLICLATAQRAGPGAGNAAALQPFASAAAAGTNWNIVLLVTWAPTDFKRLARLLTTKMSQRLAAFGVACFALNEHELAPGQPWSVHRI